MALYDITDASTKVSDQLLRLNNRFHEATSWLEAADWARLTGMAHTARACLEDQAVAGFLIAFDEVATYDGVNFQWFRARERRFLYIDRVVIDDAHQRKGIASRLYADLIGRARAGGFPAIVCEVNYDPPNPASDAFHARLGFALVGCQTLASGKTVSYLRLAV